MTMAKMAGKVAAVLCAAAVLVPTAAVAAPAAVFANDNAIAASAATYTKFTGNQYVAVGDTATFTVTPATSGSYTYEWYTSTQKINSLFPSDYTWTKMSETSNTFSFKMTEKLNGAHIWAVKVDTATGEREEMTNFSTVCCTKVNFSLGTPVITSDDYGPIVKIPVIASGLINNSIDAYQAKLSFDTSVFEDADFTLSAKGSFDVKMGNMQSDGYLFAGGCNASYLTVGSDNVLGYYTLYVKDGANYLGSEVSLDVTSAALTNVSGDLIYGIENSGAVTVAAPATYPTNIQVQYSSEYHQVRFTWDAVAGADKYGIAVYLAGKWRIQTSSLTTTSYTTPKNLTPGKSYKVAIAARVNGVWDTANAIKNAVTVTVQ